MDRSPASQLKTITALFIVLRLTLLLLYTPQGLLNAYTNYHFYYLIAQFSEQGRWPFLNMWYEYPPLSAYVPELAYWLTRAILPAGDLQSFTYQFYARVLGCLLLVFETGVLVLLHRIAAIAWNEEKANWVAWVYSALSVPLFYWNTAQDVVVVFFMLLAIYSFITQRVGRSALALGLGIAAKLSPIFLLGPVVKWLWPQRRPISLYVLVTALTAGAIYAPFVALGGGQWVAASFASLLKHDSWATVWAMLDNNWGPGTVGALTARFTLNQAGIAGGNPSLLPGWVTLGVFAVGYALVFFRPAPREARHFIWFTTLTAMGLHLWSKGWSPQWATLLFPLILLSFPDGRGLKLSLLFTAIIFLEWPMADVLQSRAVLGAAILCRTAFFVAVAGLTLRALWPSGPKMAAA